jgi:hypothetical protein
MSRLASQAKKYKNSKRDFSASPDVAQPLGKAPAGLAVALGTTIGLVFTPRRRRGDGEGRSETRRLVRDATSAGKRRGAS